MRVHISHTAESHNSPRTIKSVERLAGKGFAKQALWIGVMPVGMSFSRHIEPELIGLYYHTIRAGRHPAGNGHHHFRAQILEQRTGEPSFEYEPLRTAGGVRAILAATAAVDYLKTTLPNAWSIVVTKPAPFNPDVKDWPMPIEDILTAHRLADQELSYPAIEAPKL